MLIQSGTSPQSVREILGQMWHGDEEDKEEEVEEEEEEEEIIERITSRLKKKRWSKPRR